MAISLHIYDCDIYCDASLSKLRYVMAAFWRDETKLWNIWLVIATLTVLTGTLVW